MMVRLDKEWEKHKASKEKVEVKPKQSKPITTDNEQITKLCEDYPAVAIELRKWVKDKIDYYTEHPFKSRTRNIIYDKIKENIIFTNPNIKERKPKPIIQQKNEELLEQFKKNILVFTNKKDLAQQFINIHPCYYDKYKNWWLWNYKSWRWERVDETDILNAVESQARVNTISSKERNEVIEALKQVSRKNAPSNIKATWIQFRDTIIDIETGEHFKASSQWFVTNPIPYKLHNNNFEETPTIDRIFEEWVGKDYVKTLYEIIAYCLLPDYPIHRIFCFIGSGMNGKSCFLGLLRKFIGNENCASSELDSLINSRFEISRLHKKLVCLMGETNFNELSKTSMLKKLSGGDLIGYEYKNKDPFEEVNYAKILIATNNLPTTTDKTIGFYRRWMIIDFPNQFSEQKEILQDIPEEEYNSLGLKCCSILKDLLTKRKFHKEGSVEQRKERYEAKSDFLKTFLEKFTLQDVNGYITKSDFFKKFSGWCKENRHREMSDASVSLQMKKLGIEGDRKYFDYLYDGKGGQARIWVGIKWKD